MGTITQMRIDIPHRNALACVWDRTGENNMRPTIREEFNTYRCANHEEKVIDLLAGA